MFKKHDKIHHRRGTSLPFVIFRFFLSGIIFFILIGGLYTALRGFSGIDPLKIEPDKILSSFTSKEKLMEFGLGLLETSSKIDLGSKLDKEEVEEDGLKNFDNQQKERPDKQLLFKFAIVTDSHNDNDNLTKALSEAKQLGGDDLKFVVGLGDYTEVGTDDELVEAKAIFDTAGIKYFVTAGDHDLWDSRDKGEVSTQNFGEVFGTSYQSFDIEGVSFIMIDNSDNYLGLDTKQLDWLNQKLAKLQDDQPKSVYVFAHEPLYHPSSSRIMGKVTPNLLEQSKQLIKTLSDAKITALFSGDIHFFTQYSDPESGLEMNTIGALTQLRNVQTPRFGMVSIFEDGSYYLEDIEIR